MIVERAVLFSESQGSDGKILLLFLVAGKMERGLNDLRRNGKRIWCLEGNGSKKKLLPIFISLSVLPHTYVQSHPT